MIKEKFQAQKAINYKIETSNSCKISGCSESEKGCRCTKITKSEVIDVDMLTLSKLVFDSYYPSDDKRSYDRNSVISSLFYGGKETDVYCINRILTKLKVYQKDIWSVNIVDGYYGEVVDSITFKDKKLIDEINSHLTRILKYDTLKEKLEYCLMLEYGRVLAILSDKDYEEEQITYQDIVFSDSNQLHINRITFENLDHYSDKNYDLARGVVKKITNKYYLIDGFHRILAMKSSPDIRFPVYSVIG